MMSLKFVGKSGWGGGGGSASAWWCFLFFLDEEMLSFWAALENNRK